MLIWTERQTDNQSEQRNISGTVSLFCDWLICVRVSGNRFEWESGQTQSSEQMKHAAQRNLDWFPGYQEHLKLTYPVILCNMCFLSCNKQIFYIMDSFVNDLINSLTCHLVFKMPAIFQRLHLEIACFV